MKLRDIKKRFKDKHKELRHEHPVKRFVFWAGLSVASFFILGFFTVFATFVILSITLPNVKDLDNLSAALSTQIYDRNGELLYAIHGEENREQVPYNEISENIIKATVAIEDDQFWEHSGFDLPGIVRAGMHSVFGIGKARGGSTITQQYIKNAFLSPEKTYTRKIKELILAIKLENAYDKEKILELYLNKIPYGNNAYGIEKAAQTYFEKSAKDLSVAESAVLAAIPKAPSYYNPLGPNKFTHLNSEFTLEEAKEIKNAEDIDDEDINFGLIGNYVNLTEALNQNDETATEETAANNTKPTSTEEKEVNIEELKKNFKVPENSIYLNGRADLVLERMTELGHITEEQAADARIEMQVLEFQPYRDPIKHPHFVFYVRQILEEKYGKEIVEQGGLKVTTTIDSKLQSKAEEMLKTKALANQKNYGAENASLVAINPKNGQIISMIGSADYFNEEIDGNVNVAERKRQPGSSFKPFAYAQAFYNGYGPASVVYDVETRIGPDIPQNYDGKFFGPLSIRRALAQSRNIPAVKAYFLAGEQDPIIDLAANMGIGTLDKDFDYGYPLALGAGEATLLDMVSAYGVFANGGVRNEPVAILKVENSNGDVLEEWKEEEHKGKEVLDPQIAYLITDILSDTGPRLGQNLTVEGQVNAAKTGTSTDKNKKEAGVVRPRDLWTLGYTTDLVAGVWAGNNKPGEKPLKLNANGYDAAAPIWKAFMKEALKESPRTEFPVPEGIKYVEVSTASGKLPSKYTPESMVVTEKFASFAVPDEVDDVFVQAEVDLISGMIIGEGCQRELTEFKTFMHHKPIEDRANWAAGIAAWVETMRQKAIEEGTAATISFAAPPTEECTAPSEEEKTKMPEILITSPAKLAGIPPAKSAVEKLPVEVDVNAPFGVYKVDFYFDDSFQNTQNEAPYTGQLRIGQTLSPGSKHIIKVKVFDKKGFSAESSIEIKIAKEGEEENNSSDGPTNENQTDNSADDPQKTDLNENNTKVLSETLDDTATDINTAEKIVDFQEIQ